MILSKIQELAPGSVADAKVTWDIDMLLTGDATFRAPTIGDTDPKTTARRLLREHCEATLRGDEPSKVYQTWFALVGLAYLDGEIETIESALKLNGRQGRPSPTLEQIEAVRAAYQSAWPKGHPGYVLPEGCETASDGHALTPKGADPAEFATLLLKLTRESEVEHERHARGLELAYEALHGENVVKARRSLTDKEYYKRMDRVKALLQRYGNIWLDDTP
ncbi:hypothetical protein [Ralstonia soli]|uniref:Uncharacterized protein n=1 Tax=Ralstonia soli TaxID=2953896 RepID=A0ABT1AR20_9RALS|nr:hypothetical protein [Ralstonia soli]MCO5400743.1 hypothetical protein [Ralstonia soli]